MKTIKKHNQNGKMILEALAFLALLMVITPMIYQRTVDKNIEIEDSLIASQMRALRLSVNNFIVSNYDELVQNDPTLNVPFNAGGEGIETASLTLDQLEEFLPDGFSETNKLSGNDNYKIYLTRENLELGGMSNISISALIVANPSGDSPLTNDRGARIASMIGTEGGFIPVDGFGQTETDKTMAIGGEGLWKLDTNKYAPDIEVGKIVTSATVTPGLSSNSVNTSGQFLWRTIEGGADGNKMQSDLSLGYNNIKWLDKIMSPEIYENQFDSTYTNTTSIPEEGNVISGTTQATDTSGNVIEENYNISFSGPKTGTDEGVSLIKDLAIGALAGADIADIVPKLTLKEIVRLNKKSNNTVPMPDCPVGYAPVISIIPVISATDTDPINPVITKGSNSWRIDGLVDQKGITGDAYTYCKHVPEAFIDEDATTPPITP